MKDKGWKRKLIKMAKTGKLEHPERNNSSPMHIKYDGKTMGKRSFSSYKSEEPQ